MIVGVAQINQQPTDPTDADEAIALMIRAVRAAADDSGADTLLSRLGILGVVAGAWKYSDPGRLIVDAVGSTNARTALSSIGGNTPQSYVNSLASRIQRGQLDAAAIVGGETIWSRRRQRRDGHTVSYVMQERREPDERFGHDVAMSTEFEQMRGMSKPINYYPVFESAIRAAGGETLDQHRDRVATMWERFNRIAVDNEYAWTRTPLTVDEIRNPSPTNRMVGFPYTKAMNSNWDLDQAAALLLCSVQVAESVGVPRDRWVFPLAGTDAHDTYAVSHRGDLHSSPAIAAAGGALYDLVGVGPDDVDHIDLYSCFPSAVQVAADALGLRQDRTLTVTGGLTFAGGPLNNYVTHSIAAMTDTLRADPDTLGLVTANGGYLTKHSLGMYSARPPTGPHRSIDVQDEVDRAPTTSVDETYAGTTTIEAYTVMHDKTEPTEGLCALKTPAGARTWARVVDDDSIARLLDSEAVGAKAELAVTGLATVD